MHHFRATAGLFSALGIGGRLRPSSDHTSEYGSILRVSARSPLPSAFMTTGRLISFRPRPSVLTQAIFRPLGDHAGAESSVRLAGEVRRFKPVPSASMTCTAFRITKAIFRPSGDQSSCLLWCAAGDRLLR